MRIGHFVPTFPQPGGVGVTLTGMLEATSALGHQAHLYAYPRRGGVLHHLPWPGRVALSEVDRRLATNVDHLDALVLHGVFTPACARVARLVRRHQPEVQVVAFPHDPYDDGLLATRRALKSAYWAMIERRYLRSVHAIVITAPSHERWLRERGVATPTILASLGLGPDDVREVVRVRAERENRVQAEASLRCLFLGRWDVVEKSIDLICEALGSDDALRSAVALRIAGPELGRRDDVEALLRTNRLDPSGAVGFVDDVWALLAETDCLLLPSRKEGFGLVALQALACGIPVVLSVNAGFADYVDRDQGVVVVRAETGSIRDGLRQVLEQRRELTARAVGFWPSAGAGFTWTRTITSLVDGLNETAVS